MMMVCETQNYHVLHVFSINVIAGIEPSRTRENATSLDTSQGEKNLMWARQNMSWEKIAKESIDLYKEVQNG